MRWKATIGVILSFCIVNLSWAKDLTGSAGAAFLKIPVGSKAMAMGGGFSALADGISGSFYNPAGLVQLSRPEISTMYNSWFKGMGHGFIGFGFPITKNNALGMNIIHLGINGLNGYEDSETDTSPVSTGNFNASDTVFTLTYAHILTRYIAFGLSAKGITQKIENNMTTGFAVDFGQLYKLPVQGLTLAVVVQNLGPEIKFIGKGDKLPKTLRFGTSYRFPNHLLTVTCDMAKPIDNKWKVNAGIEVKPKESLSLRAGFNSQVFEDFGEGITAGFGFKVLPYHIDYAFVPYDQLGKTHKISITFRFDAE